MAHPLAARFSVEKIPCDLVEKRKFTGLYNNFCLRSLYFYFLMIIDRLRKRIKSGAEVAAVAVQTDPRIAITNHVCNRNQCLLR